MDFSSRAIMVTGGSSGIGLCCVQQFLRAGASVVVLDRGDAIAGELASAGDRLLCVKGDVAQADEVAKAVQCAVDRFGKLDVGVNCAGITGVRMPLIDQADNALDELLAVNVRGIFLSMKYQLRAMIAHGVRGSVVNVASVFAFRAWETYGLYAASKHAVAGLTKAAALEMAPFGIRVNAVAPGPIRTPFIGQLTEEKERRAIATVPAGRLGTPEDAANAITWLASDRAGFVTGAIVPVDGGINAKMYAG